MIIDQKLWNLIHEYKLVELQAAEHLRSNNIDEYIDCIDEMFKLKAEIEKYHWELNYKIILFLN